MTNENDNSTGLPDREELTGMIHDALAKARAKGAFKTGKPKNIKLSSVTVTADLSKLPQNDDTIRVFGLPLEAVSYLFCAACEALSAGLFRKSDEKAASRLCAWGAGVHLFTGVAEIVLDQIQQKLVKQAETQKNQSWTQQDNDALADDHTITEDGTVSVTSSNETRQK